MTVAFGRPVTGDVKHYTTVVSQDDPAKFIAALDEVLALPNVEAVKWTQYTPYFNDGDACVFGASEVRVRIIDDADDVGEYEDGYRTYYDLYELGPGRGERVWFDINGVSSEVYATALRDFENLLSSGRHDAVLSAEFGDPAEVVATTAGFEVEFYDHD